MTKRIFLAVFLSFAATELYSQNSQENEFAPLPQGLMEKMWEARTITGI
ncbi:hypothetical protein IT568_00090, partial [bacterium]|nr:hypothetical protein [bacterium]